MKYKYFPYKMSKDYRYLKYLLDKGNVLLGKIWYERYRNWQVISIKKIGEGKAGYYDFGVLGCGFLTIDGRCTEEEFVQKCKEEKVEFIRPSINKARLW